MELTSNEKVWLSLKDIQDILSVSKTKAHQIARQIRVEDGDPDAVIKFGRCVRISKDALMRFIQRHRYPTD
jgi:Helix-turn-helix domain